MKKLRKKALRLKGLSMDMSRAFYSAVKQELPDIAIVFDHFHVMQLMTRALDDLRKEQQAISNQTLKGNRFLLLKNYTSLDINGKERLNTLLNLNKPLFVAHALKEQFRELWNQPN